jgi:hypothetical protein
MRRRLPVVAIVLAVLPVAGGCGAGSDSSNNVPTPTPRDCRALTFPYPTADATLMPADNGRTVHVPVGGLVEVDLIGSPSRRWSPLVLAGTALVSLGTQAETPTLGTRLDEYCAISPGTASLSASDGTVQWSATIAVP